MLELYPEGFEELEGATFVELAAYGEYASEHLAPSFGQMVVTDVADDWAERWREFHRPVRIGPLWVGPPWLDPPTDAIAVVIEPGRAFGTGAHPTTRLCLELLLDLRPGSLLDIGCGSGVLAIAAAKLGFEPVIAFDHDEAAVEAAELNAAANGVALQVERRDALDRFPLPKVDVAVANITLDALHALSPHLQARLLLSSGYLDGDDARPHRFQRLARGTADGWAAELYARQ